MTWTRSTRCDAGQCLEAAYRRSTRCEANGCVEAAHRGGQVLVRSSQEPGDVLTVDAGSWSGLLEYVRADR